MLYYCKGYNKILNDRKDVNHVNFSQSGHNKNFILKINRGISWTIYIYRLTIRLTFYFIFVFEYFV